MKKFITLTVLVSMMASLLIGCGNTTDTEETSTESTITETSTEESAEQEEFTWEFEEMTADKETEAAEYMLDTFSKLKMDNTYLQVYVGQDMANTYVYNKNGEVLFTMYDGSYFTIFRNDGLATIFADEILTAVDIDVLTILEGVATVARDSDNTQIFNVDSSDIADTERDWTRRYRVVVNDYDDLKEIYSSAGDEYSQTVVDGVKESVGDTFQLSYYFTEFDDGHISVECGIEEDGADALVWYFDGYYTIYDWLLADDWYADDFTEFDAETMEGLAQDVLADVKQSIIDFANDNGLELETIESEEETTEETSTDTETVEETPTETELIEETQTEESETVSEESTESEETVVVETAEVTEAE